MNRFDAGFAGGRCAFSTDSLEANFTIHNIFNLVVGSAGHALLQASMSSTQR